MQEEKEKKMHDLSGKVLGKTGEIIRWNFPHRDEKKESFSDELPRHILDRNQIVM